MDHGIALHLGDGDVQEGVSKGDSAVVTMCGCVVSGHSKCGIYAAGALTLELRRSRVSARVEG